MNITDLPTDLPRKYRFTMRQEFRFGRWEFDYSLIGARGGVNLHITGPHRFDGQETWGVGLEYHSRTPRSGSDCAPSHDECWLLKCPCWHDGTSLYAEEHYLPMFKSGLHGAILAHMAFDADRYFEANDEQ